MFGHMGSPVFQLIQHIYMPFDIYFNNMTGFDSL